MRAVFNPTYQDDKKELLSFIENFTTSGESFGNGDRNRIKLFDFKARKINIKAFKTPNLINQFAYKYIRHSKAERSFEYANKLTDLGIGTPEPIAYIENYGGLGLKDSYYISFHDEPKYTYRDLVHHFDLPHYDKILRAFTKFSFQLHEKGVEFLDHSPGNTLIYVKPEGGFEFKLVDLNRMRFRALDFDSRMKNLSRLTPKREMIEVMADEYAKHYTKTSVEVFDLLWHYTSEFQRKFHKKQALKRKFKGR
ncbi:Lipopolysaccharide kinase (Kdo/WaaP) family protein [Psychroflexus salarius]|uniref:Lipopolysaccharide kinase (Kdo/WaaP) family protein n=1 Tax=Psychroflexus salarius TaxID=1155689 RepID=A0A1M4Y012_9FLAO|nr:Kdo domain containing protein [Psychroflexus salarius]SHE99019.1 Lipopolysaccharide kinase (Kdo/WaaP) family protein [Psychroflexus salarius]